MRKGGEDNPRKGRRRLPSGCDHSQNLSGQRIRASAWPAFGEIVKPKLLNLLPPGGALRHEERVTALSGIWPVRVLSVCTSFR